MEYQIIKFNRAEVLERFDEIQRFMHSLQEEKLTFALQSEQLLEAHCLAVAMDVQGKWLGVAGYRFKYGIGLFFLVIHREAQSKGLGKQLAQQVLAAYSPWKLMLLTVTRSNDHARRLYDGVGFKTLNRTRLFVVMGLNRGIFKLLQPFLVVALKFKNF
jgi:ribosomal protein S18 acetylase RimI-like enzyme